jgi:hypothetical protein
VEGRVEREWERESEREREREKARWKGQITKLAAAVNGLILKQRVL